MGQVVSFYSGKHINGVSVEDIELGKVMVKILSTRDINEYTYFVHNDQRFKDTMQHFNGMLSGYTYTELEEMIEDEDYGMLEIALQAIMEELFS